MFQWYSSTERKVYQPQELTADNLLNVASYPFEQSEACGQSNES